MFGGLEDSQFVFKLSDFFLFDSEGFIIGEKNVGFVVKFEDFLFDLFDPTICFSKLLRNIITLKRENYSQDSRKGNYFEDFIFDSFEFVLEIDFSERKL